MPGELFMDTGIGVDGYSIIGQGKICGDCQHQAGRTDGDFRRGGGNRFTKPASRMRSGSRVRIDNLNARDIISKLKTASAALRSDSEKAQEYIRLRDRYKVLAVNIILHSIGNLERNVESGKTELEELTREYNELLEQKSALDRQVEECRIRDAELSRQYEECNRQLREKTEELNLITNRGQINS